MSGRLRPLLGAACALLVGLLVGCGERAQKLDDSAKKSDAPAWSVADSANPAFAAPGWKAGDKSAWEAQMRRRNQTQNENVR